MQKTHFYPFVLAFDDDLNADDYRTVIKASPFAVDNIKYGRNILHINVAVSWVAKRPLEVSMGGTVSFMVNSPNQFRILMLAKSVAINRYYREKQ